MNTACKMPRLRNSVSLYERRHGAIARTKKNKKTAQIHICAVFLHEVKEYEKLLEES